LVQQQLVQEMQQRGWQTRSHPSRSLPFVIASALKAFVGVDLSALKIELLTLPVSSFRSGLFQPSTRYLGEVEIDPMYEPLFVAYEEVMNMYRTTKVIDLTAPHMVVATAGTVLWVLLCGTDKNPGLFQRLAWASWQHLGLWPENFGLLWAKMVSTRSELYRVCDKLCCHPNAADILLELIYHCEYRRCGGRPNWRREDWIGGLALFPMDWARPHLEDKAKVQMLDALGKIVSSTIRNGYYGPPDYDDVHTNSHLDASPGSTSVGYLKQYLAWGFRSRVSPFAIARE
jgi:hypothetical protein